MIVLVVTVLGITAINTSSMGGKLSRNFQERAIAFQSAERALRAGEQVLNGLTAAPATCNTGSCTFWDRNALQSVSGTTGKWWQVQDAAWWDSRGAVTIPVSADSTARYIIEERSFVQNNTQANIIGSGLNYYTVTAMGARINSGSEVVLQSHYMKRFN